MGQCREAGTRTSGCTLLLLPLQQQQQQPHRRLTPQQENGVLWSHMAHVPHSVPTTSRGRTSHHSGPETTEVTPQIKGSKVRMMVFTSLYFCFINCTQRLLGSFSPNASFLSQVTGSSLSAGCGSSPENFRPCISSTAGLFEASVPPQNYPASCESKVYSSAPG